MDVIKTLIPYLSLYDVIAVVMLAVLWQYLNFAVEGGMSKRLSTYTLMSRYRSEWMEALLTRENRIGDTNALGNLQQSSRFFASGMMIAIGGLIALTDRTGFFVTLANDIMMEPNADDTALALLWDLKIFFTALIVTSGFLKFMWANRLFGYCSILMVAIHDKGLSDHTGRVRATKAAAINKHAARSFNRGLRAIYFALAALVWLIGAIPFIMAIIGCGIVLYRREFFSASRAILIEGDI